MLWALAAMILDDPAPPPLEVSVVSFNIRFGTADDGDNSWPNRMAHVQELVQEWGADFLGLQEALDFQIDQILAADPRYAALGVGRDDGLNAGEFSPILFRRDRWRVAESGTFWLSDTPEVVASRTWGNTLPRICTWGRFVHTSGQSLYVYNTHWDHASQEAREGSAALIAQRVNERSFAHPAIVTGDFNAGESNPAARIILEQGSLVNTFRALNPDATRVGTFTGFDPEAIDGEKIDYVLAKPDLKIVLAEILRPRKAGKAASDHDPVVAKFELP